MPPFEQVCGAHKRSPADWTSVPHRRLYQITGYFCNTTVDRTVEKQPCTLIVRDRRLSLTCPSCVLWDVHEPLYAVPIGTARYHARPHLLGAIRLEHRDLRIEITDGFVPGLQRRGLTRTDRTDAHFRDNLLAF